MTEGQHFEITELSGAESAVDAELNCDSLHELVARTAIDRGAPFEPKAMELLADLHHTNQAAFERLRADLKTAGCRVTVLDKALAIETADAGGDPKQADLLIGIASDSFLFHSMDGGAYADIQINGHRETWAVRSKGFKRWLVRGFYQKTAGAPGSDALQSALNVIEAKAQFDGPKQPVFIRIGGDGGKLYLDLCDEEWSAVEVDVDGWRVIDHSPVRFRRSSGMKSLPIPVIGGSIEELRPFLNVSSQADFALVVAWALAVLRDRGPYPVLVLSGEQGSAKSTFSSMLRALLDPNAAPLRAMPKEDRDLFIAANNGHMLTFDNISGLPNWISDSLCRLATGGGFATRQLYSDQDEVLFDAARPIILNGIEDIVERPDLADRALFLTLESIPEDRRRPEAELWKDFENSRPRILGVLLDAIVEGLKRLPSTKLPKLPRMADFALWASACETSLWPAGTFWAAYNTNREDAVDDVIEADPIASAIRAYMTNQPEWTGTASELLRDLSKLSGGPDGASKGWPRNPRAMSGRLRRVATFLRKVGVDVRFLGRQGKNRNRMICITESTET